MSQSGPVPNWTLTPNPHSMKDKRRCRRFLTGFGDPERSAGRRAQKARYSWSLLMGHGEDAVPSGGRLIEEILLAAFPIHAGGSIFRPFLQKLLEVLLRFLPPAAVVEVAGARELFETQTQRVRCAINPQFRFASDELVDGYGLEFAFDTHQVEFTKNETAGLGRIIRRFVYDDMRAVVLIKAFEARG